MIFPLGAIGTAMNEIDVLKKISSNLTERKNSAALSNYRVLCSNIAFLNEAFSKAISTLQLLHGGIAPALKNDSLLNSQYKSGTDLNAFIPIVSRTLRDKAVRRRLLLFWAIKELRCNSAITI